MTKPEIVILGLFIIYLATDIAMPEEIAHAVVFLASSKASYITGICMSMDGALNPIVV